MEVLTTRPRGDRQRLRIGNALLIVNPASRRGLASVAVASGTLSSLGLACDVAVSERPGHAGEIAAARAADYDAIFSLGGDGTAVEVIGALVPNGPPVGILPGGTGNLVARALGIPMSMAKAATLLARGDEMRFDLGRLSDGTRFAVGAGVGIDASMIAGTSHAWKRRAGVLAYIATGAVHVLRRRHFTATVTVDGNTVTRRAAVVLVANFGVLLNGIITLGAGIRPDDGQLDVCIFDPGNLADTVRITRKLLFRNFASPASLASPASPASPAVPSPSPSPDPDPAMTYLRGSHVTIHTEPALPTQADGELIGNTPLVATVEPLAASLLVPHCQINRQ